MMEEAGAKQDWFEEMVRCAQGVFEDALRAGCTPEDAARMADYFVAIRVLRRRLKREPTEREVECELQKLWL